MTRRVSIRDVAEAAGVSAATVSKVLRGDVSVKQSNRLLVSRVVHELGYRADPLAANLRRGQRSLIGVIVPEFENPFFGGVVSALEGLADAEGMTLVAMSSWESAQREAELIWKMSDWRVAGLVIAPVSSSGAAARLLRKCDLRATLIDRADPDGSFDFVSSDDRKAAAEVARHLVAAGHRRILLVGSSPTISNIRARIEGFRDEALRLAPSTRIDIAYCGLDRAGIERMIAAEIARLPRPTAIFSLYAPGLTATLATCRDQGWRCPQDVSLVSFDDADWLACLDPAIAAVAQPVREIGLEAMRLLLARIRSGSGPPETRRLACTFRKRGSIAPPGGTN
ncbi:MAG TPA: LacI family DNA-binding transcriptional regulator [Paracoccaceae bacterium]|nr:LacI family DNA-binding transcriptional regulator [Paracoccaceae bacterium]